jgi:hypothetical protein
MFSKAVFVAAALVAQVSLGWAQSPAKPFSFGLWGDIGFALLGVFLIGTLMKAFDVSLTNWIASLNLGPLNDVTKWVDVFVVAFLGALVLRGILRPITGRG